MSKPFLLSAPSRIHFGLFSVGNLISPRFGGLGLMVAEPRTEVRFSDAAQLRIECGTGDVRSRCQKIAGRWFAHLSGLLDPRYRNLESLPVSIEVCNRPTAHAGLGSGTQLALAVFSGLSHFFGLPMMSIAEMAAVVNRGRRSAIGTHGFFQGGFLVDRGKTDSRNLAPLDLRLEFPVDWPIFLITPISAAGLSGSQELAAFGKLPDTTPDQRQSLIGIAKHGVIPGLARRDFSSFAAAIHEFGRQSGLLYETVQGGPYNGSEIDELIDKIQKLGFAAIGQSSWGPTVYAVVESAGEAQRLARFLESDPGLRFVVTSADNFGARLEQPGSP